MRTYAAMIALIGGAYAFGIAYAQHGQHGGSDHLMASPADFKWTPVAAIPGAQMAVIEGPLNEAGKPFTARSNSRRIPKCHRTGIQPLNT